MKTDFINRIPMRSLPGIIWTVKGRNNKESFLNLCYILEQEYSFNNPSNFPNNVDEKVFLQVPKYNSTNNIKIQFKEITSDPTSREYFRAVKYFIYFNFDSKSSFERNIFLNK